jgi:hypothetical protein
VQSYLKGNVGSVLDAAIAKAAKSGLSGRTLTVPVGPFTLPVKIHLTAKAKGFTAGTGSLSLARGAQGKLKVTLSKKARKLLAKKGKLKVATAITITAPTLGVTATTAGTVTFKTKKKR